MKTIDKARKLITLMAIAVGLDDEEEYQEAMELAERWKMYLRWDEIPDRYRQEWVRLIEDYRG